jgi:general stress protein 26
MTEERDRLNKLLSKFDNAMLITRGAAGSLNARPMAIAHLSPGADAFFVTSLQSHKVAEIEADPRVLVTFQGGGAYASISGNARIVHDRALIDRYWSDAWSIWFPDGKDDPDICVIAVLADEGEYWDRAGVEAIRFAFQAVKAAVTGKPVDVGNQHARVKL